MKKLCLILLASSSLHAKEIRYKYLDSTYSAAIDKGAHSWAKTGFLIKKDNAKPTVKIAWMQGANFWVGYFNPGSQIYLNSLYKRRLKSKDWAGVTAHEIGHFLGLGHNNERNSTMNSSEDYDTLPSARDIARARANGFMQMPPTICEGR